MNDTLKQIFETNTIEVDTSGKRKAIHSHTSIQQCLFIQSVFDKVNPKKTLEIGLAMGMSALSILEKHREKKNEEKCHIISEPFPWDGIAEYNIEKEGLTKYCDFNYKTSDHVVTELFRNNTRIQMAYIDTTKLVDVVMQDFYFIDKIMDVGGVVILDDCGGSWPGIQKVARFVNTLPHYKKWGAHYKVKASKKQVFARFIVTTLISLVPFKKKFFGGYSFKTDEQLGLDYNCIAFEKISEDKRDWSWDKPW